MFTSKSEPTEDPNAASPKSPAARSPDAAPEDHVITISDDEDETPAPATANRPTQVAVDLLQAFLNSLRNPPPVTLLDQPLSRVTDSGSITEKYFVPTEDDYGPPPKAGPQPRGRLPFLFLDEIRHNILAQTEVMV